MEQVDVEFNHLRGPKRTSDVIWRLPMSARGEIYLYLLIEFQSRSDWWMAVRIQSYVSLLWQKIIAEKRLKTGDPLPPILPIVLYNGAARWSAPLDVAELLCLPPESPLWRWSPRLRYYLLDEGARQDDAAQHDDLVATLFQLEHCADPALLAHLIDRALRWFTAHPDYAPLRSLMGDMVRSALHAVGGAQASLAASEDLWEVRQMLVDRFRSWIDDAKAQGVAQGMAQGEDLGVAKTLLRLAEQRFGPLSAATQQTILAAPAPQVDQWLSRLFTAPSLDALLGDAPSA